VLGLTQQSVRNLVNRYLESGGATVLRARFKTCQLSLTLQAPTRQLRAPTGRLRFAVVTPVASEAVLKQALKGEKEIEPEDYKTRYWVDAQDLERETVARRKGGTRSRWAAAVDDTEPESRRFV
jgi:hypothetical protein